MNNESNYIKETNHGLEPASVIPVAQEISRDFPHVLKPWGFWATMGWSLLIGLMEIVGGMAVLVVLLIWASVNKPDLNMIVYIETISESGWFFSLSYIVASLVGCGFIFLPVVIRRYPISKYLALRLPSGRQLAFWSLAMIIFIIMSDGITWLSERPIVSPFMINIYKTAGLLPILLFTLIVAAPVAEELLFRGFMYTGLTGSPVGNVGAIVIPSLIWAALHLQYDWYGILTIFLMGLLLGVCRWLTKSTITTMVLHAIASLVATLEVMVVVHN